MDTPSLIEEGVNLMLFGMGFVFVFLTLLVIVTSLMSWIIIKVEKNIGVIPDEGVAAPTTFIPQHGPLAEQAQVDDKTLISVLTAVVHKFRSGKK